MTNTHTINSMTPSAVSTKGHNERLRSAFLMLLFIENIGAINWDVIPKNQSPVMKRLLADWRDGKLNRTKRIRGPVVLDQLAVSFLSSLGSVSDPCGDLEVRHSEEALNYFCKNRDMFENVIGTGWVTLVASDDLSSLVLKRTITGTKALTIE